MHIGAILGGKGGAVITAAPDMPVLEVARLLSDKKIGSVLIVRDGIVVGVVSERDIVRELGRRRMEALDLTAQDIMTQPVVSIESKDSVVGALALMTDRRIRHLPVLESGALVGIVSIGDLVKARIAEVDYEVIALKEYIISA